MSSNNREVSIGGMILLFVVLLNVVIVQHAFIRNANWYWALFFTLPLLMLAVYDMRQKNDE
jgi:hypothetical protein